MRNDRVFEYLSGNEWDFMGATNYVHRNLLKSTQITALSTALFKQLGVVKTYYYVIHIKTKAKGEVITLFRINPKKPIYNLGYSERCKTFTHLHDSNLTESAFSDNL